MNFNLYHQTLDLLQLYLHLIYFYTYNNNRLLVFLFSAIVLTTLQFIIIYAISHKTEYKSIFSYIMALLCNINIA